MQSLQLWLSAVLVLYICNFFISHSCQKVCTFRSGHHWLQSSLLVQRCRGYSYYCMAVLILYFFYLKTHVSESMHMYAGYQWLKYYCFCRNAKVTVTTSRLFWFYWYIFFISEVFLKVYTCMRVILVTVLLLGAEMQRLQLSLSAVLIIL